MLKVDKAIILAAGIGKRMQPVTLNTPKPLIQVNGVRMIDLLIQTLHENGIYEIYIVVGYLKEQFQYLEQEHENLKTIENPYYYSCNNISSLYVARDHISNAFILDADQMVYNAAILNPDFIRSGYNAVWTDTHTNEWLMTVENDAIVHCSRTGGAHGWQLFSISRWSMEDGKKLKHHLEIEFMEKRNRQIYWDDVALFYYNREYKLSVYPMRFGDIVEIDSLRELAEIDDSYKKYICEGHENG